jgi:hypothetical protein
MPYHQTSLTLPFSWCAAAHSPAWMHPQHPPDQSNWSD